jgi:hypothetical protein
MPDGDAQPEAQFGVHSAGAVGAERGLMHAADLLGQPGVPQ